MIFSIYLGDFFEEKGYFNSNIWNTQYYKVFLDFNKEILKGGVPKNVELKIKEKFKGIYSFNIEKNIWSVYNVI